MEDEGASYGAALKGEMENQSALGCFHLKDMTNDLNAYSHH
jgi:hypothetical protein